MGSLRGIKGVHSAVIIFYLCNAVVPDNSYRGSHFIKRAWLFSTTNNGYYNNHNPNIFNQRTHHHSI